MAQNKRPAPQWEAFATDVLENDHTSEAIKGKFPSKVFDIPTPVFPRGKMTSTGYCRSCEGGCTFQVKAVLQGATDEGKHEIAFSTSGACGDVPSKRLLNKHKREVTKALAQKAEAPSHLRREYLVANPDAAVESERRITRVRSDMHKAERATIAGSSPTRCRNSVRRRPGGWTWSRTRLGACRSWP